jgi:hypothetical protein
MIWRCLQRAFFVAAGLSLCHLFDCDLVLLPQLKVSASRGAVEEPHCIDEKFLSLIRGIGSAPFRVTLFFFIF